MNTHRLVQIEVAASLESLVRAFMRLTPMALGESAQERLVLASACEGDDYSLLVAATRRTARVMEDIAYDCAGDISDLSAIARKARELGSVMHISRAYPDKALVRAKAIGGAFRDKQRVRRVSVVA